MKPLRTFVHTCLMIGCVTLLMQCSDNEEAKPAIESIAPGNGEEGDEVIITGSRLSNAKVFFGAKEALVIEATETQLTTQVPQGAPEGNVDVTVRNDGGASNPLQFYVLPPAPNIPSASKATTQSTVPAVSYKGYPVMIRGKNLKQAQKVLFNNTEATIVTKYNTSVTVLIPDLANGAYTVKVITAENGTSDGITLNVVAAPAGFPAPPAVGFISPPPATFVNAVSNDWGTFLLSVGFDAGQCQLVDLRDDKFCGTFKFEKDPVTKQVTENYIQYTRDKVEYFYGQWSSSKVNPCIQRLVFISGKTGRVSTAQVDTSEFNEGCQN